MKRLPYYTIVGAAEECGVTDAAIRIAIHEREELTPIPTSCGRIQLLRRADVLKWKNTTRKRGPKPKTSGPRPGHGHGRRRASSSG